MIEPYAEDDCKHWPMDAQQAEDYASIALAAMEMVGKMAYADWSASLIPNGRSDIYRNPQVGDMAMEITSMFRHEPAFTRIGRIVAMETDPTCQSEFIYTLQLLNGERITWQNAMMIRIPDLCS